MTEVFDRTIPSKILLPFPPKFISKKRIRRLVPSVFKQRFQGKGNIIFEETVPSKTSVKAI